MTGSGRRNVQKHAVHALQVNLEGERRAGDSGDAVSPGEGRRELRGADDVLLAADQLDLEDKIICDIFKHSPVFRIGGDEFVAIADGADYKDADKLLEQLKENNATPGAIVIAYGLARNEGDRNVAAVFARADALMYENKRMLKNQK